MQRLFSTIICICFSAVLSAQFTIGLKAGYNSPTNIVGYANGLTDVVKFVNPGPFGFTSLVLNNNIAKGFNADVYLSEKINDNFSFVGSAGYLFTNNITSTSDLFGSKVTNTLKSKIAKFGIGFGIQKEVNNVAVYNNLLAVGAGVLINYITEQKNGGADFMRELEVKNGIPIGFENNLGVSYKWYKNFSVFAELHLQQMTYTPQNAKVKKQMTAGKDDLPNLTRNQKEMIFKKEPIGSFDVTQPQQLNLIEYPMNTIGANLGIKIAL
jgi:hypothetical protein